MHKSAQQVAEAAAAAMQARDRVAHALGMKLLGAGPGSASMKMKVREDMANVHDTCHGGLHLHARRHGFFLLLQQP